MGQPLTGHSSKEAEKARSFEVERILKKNAEKMEEQRRMMVKENEEIMDEQRRRMKEERLNLMERVRLKLEAVRDQ